VNALEGVVEQYVGDLAAERRGSGQQERGYRQYSHPGTAPFCFSDDGPRSRGNSL